jgi:DNA-binding NtrC family response regulator
MSDDLARTTEGLPSQALPRVVVRECRLTVVGGDRDGQVFPFATDRLTLGADPRATIVIDDPTMSRFHAELTIVDGVTVVRDLGSRNGTCVDQVAVREAPLRPGSLISLGRTTLRFDVGTRQVELPLSPRDHFGRLRGRSVAMRSAFAVLEAAATSPTTVLLQGESGTGKDLAAEALHAASPRRDGPFVIVDCGAIPANLLEAELFGHEAGAFTGATAARVGAFEAAHGGTLFLDEIGELALDLQPKLLRALDRHEVQRLGSTERRAVDVRVIAATNRDLHQEVNARRFRSDLYFRLAVLVVTLPPLRERTTDLPLLVEGLLAGMGAAGDAVRAALARGELIPELLRQPWPGNVRELRNYLEAWAVRQEPAPVAGAAPTIDVDQPLRVVRERWVRHVERRYLEELLARHHDNVSAAARAAGVDRVHMHRLLKGVGLR